MLSGERMPRCPECGQLVNGHRYGVRFGALAQRIIDTVRRAGPDGINGELLFDATYGDRPGASRVTMKAYIYWINRRLAETTNVRIRGTRGGAHEAVYRIIGGARP